MEIFVLFFGFVGIYATYLVLKLLRYSCAALKIWITLHKDEVSTSKDRYRTYYEKEQE